MLLPVVALTVGVVSVAVAPVPAGFVVKAIVVPPGHAVGVALSAPEIV